MIRVVRAELLKLRRPAVMGGAAAALAALALLATILTFATAKDAAGRASLVRGNDINTTIAQLTGVGGLTRGFSIAAGFLGLLAFVLYLTSMSSEYSQGTLRAVLIRQPHRGTFLAGKAFALTLFAAVGLLVAELVAVAAAIPAAHLRGIPTSAWLTSAGLLHVGAAYINALLTASLWGAFGLTLAVLIQSTPIALGVGLAWALPLEHIIAGAWAGAPQWFPGLVTDAIAAGGTPSTTYQRAVILALAYATIGAVIAATTFVRRDVTT
jgi:ABC-2 type transport system permease protein